MVILNVIVNGHLRQIGHAQPKKGSFSSPPNNLQLF